MIFNFAKNLIVNSEKEPWKSEGIRIGWYSAPGTRKSYTAAACIVEPFLEEGGTVVIFQPRSEWHTLKEKWGSVVVAGGPFQDIPIATAQARVYAEAIVNNGVSMVFDFVETEEKDLVRFAAELLARIFTLQNVVRRPLLLLIEEASDYTPLSARGKLVEPWIYDRMKSRIVKIATQGRPLGFMVVIISQRPAQLDFTVRMMCNLSFYGKFHPKDLNDIKQVLSAYDVPIKKMAEKCVTMPHGSWITITSEGATYLTIDAKRLTPHGADTPKLEYVAPRTEETEKAVTDLTETIRKALEKRRIEQSELQKEKQKVKKLENTLTESQQEVERLRTALTVAGKITIETPPQKEIDTPALEKVQREIIADLKNKILNVFNTYPEAVILTKQPSDNKIYEVWAPKMPSLCAKRILKFLLDRKGAKYTKSQLGVQLGYKTTSGTFHGAIAFLKQNNLIKHDGNYLWVE